MSDTTVTTPTAIPRFEPGDKIGKHHVKRIVEDDDTQLIWTTACEDWCVGHNPMGDFDSVEDMDADTSFWCQHYGPDWCLTVPRLSSHDRERRAEGPAVWLDVSYWRPVDLHEWRTPVVSLRVEASTARLSAGEARSLAAALLRFADLLET